MGRSPGFGSCMCYRNTKSSITRFDSGDEFFVLYALFTLAFTVTPIPQDLNQATHSKLVGSFFNRHAVAPCEAPTPCKRVVSGTFDSPPGVLFNFPSRYLFTIGRLKYLALPHSHGCFVQAFARLVLLMFCYRKYGYPFEYGTLTLSGLAFHRVLLGNIFSLPPGCWPGT